jgi:hypothetical protein
MVLNHTQWRQCLLPDSHSFFLLVLNSNQSTSKKVECTFVQALRLCTGRTAHRGSRGIALPFHDHGTRGSEGSGSRPGRSLPPGKNRYLLYRRLGGPKGRSGQVRKISPPPGFDLRTVLSVASRYTDWAIAAHDQSTKVCEIKTIFSFPISLFLSSALFYIFIVLTYFFLYFCLSVFVDCQQ